MIDSAAAKQAFKDATDDEAKALYGWATACMEVRGLIAIEGAPTRKRRSDAGKSRDSDPPGIIRLQSSMGETIVDLRKTDNVMQPTVESVRERLRPSLSGLPDEQGVEQ